MRDGDMREGPRFRTERVRFRYQLGEVQLAQRLVDVRVDTSRFLERAVDDGSFVPPESVLESGTPCVMVLSQPIAEKLPVLSALRGCVRFAPHQYRRSTIRVVGSFDGYLKAMPPDRRRKIQQKQRRYREACGGRVPVRVFETRGELERFHAEALPLAAKTYQERLFGKGLPKSDAFLDELRTRGDEGRARAYLLDGPQGEAVAYMYVTFDAGIASYDYCGYDDAFAKISPGVVLQVAVLEDLFARVPGSIFDFGEGETQHKDTFGTESRLCADLYFFPKTARGLELLAGQAIAHGVSRGAVAALERFGLKEKVKRLLRRGIGG
jgi:CelD/BcsL family acetyltransferase involved in cellulose biosynthesis